MAAIVARAELRLGRALGEVLDAHAEASESPFSPARRRTTPVTQSGVVVHAVQARLQARGQGPAPDDTRRHDHHHLDEVATSSYPTAP